MNKIIAICGIVCSECPGFLATQKDDDAKRKEVAESWSKQYNATIKPEDINCDGCTSGGRRLFSYCNICELRKCGKEKHVENCAHCDEYACDKLTEFFAMAPQARTSLEEIRKSL